MLRSVLFIAGVVVAVGFFAPDLTGHFLDRTAATNNTRPSAGSATVPALNTNNGGHFRIPADRSGHYLTEVQINGRTLNAMVDTGASLVVLRYEDAQNLGLVYGNDRFEMSVQTANGVGRAHRIKLYSVRLGSILLDDVDALIMEQGLLQTNLLGMSLLKRLSRYEVRGDTLILER